MSEQPKTTNESRRRLVRAALAAPPLLATLSARPVHAVKGISNMASGDASNCRGDNRYGGMGPHFWCRPHGKTHVYYDDVQDAWNLAGCHYGDLRPNTNSKTYDGSEWNHYRQGTRCSDVFGNGDDRRLRRILNKDSGSDFLHLICGLLNARYYEARGGGANSTLYFMTEWDFWAMHSGQMPVPQPYSSLHDFIAYHYDDGPGSDCSTWS